MPLNIHNTYYLSISVDTNTSYADDQAPDFTNLDVKAQLGTVENDETQFQVIVSVKLDSDDRENIPYSFSIIGIALVECLIQDKNERIFKAAHNGAGIVYAGIREQLAMISSRSLFGGITLPTYYFSQKDFLEPKFEIKK
jgi:hypothetical protein